MHLSVSRLPGIRLQASAGRGELDHACVGQPPVARPASAAQLCVCGDSTASFSISFPAKYFSPKE